MQFHRSINRQNQLWTHLESGRVGKRSERFETDQLSRSNPIGTGYPPMPTWPNQTWTTFPEIVVSSPIQQYVESIQCTTRQKTIGVWEKGMLLRQPRPFIAWHATDTHWRYFFVPELATPFQFWHCRLSLCCRCCCWFCCRWIIGVMEMTSPVSDFACCVCVQSWIMETHGRVQLLRCLLVAVVVSRRELLSWSIRSNLSSSPTTRLFPVLCR